MNDFNIPENKIEIIYNGIPAKKKIFTLHEEENVINDLQSSGKIIIGSIGSLVIAKGHKYLVESLMRLPEAIREKIVVIVVGEGPLEADIKKIVDEKNLGNIVKFLGYREDIGNILNLCNFITISSIQEGLSRIAVEAYLQEKPAVVFGLDFAYEIIQSEKTGIIVPLLNIDAFAKAIKKYVEQPELAKKHGIAGKLYIADKFSLQNMIKEYRLVYQNLTSINGLLKKQLTCENVQEEKNLLELQN